MNTTFKLLIRRTITNGLKFIVLFLSILILSCNSSSSPQKVALGTWVRDSGCEYDISASKLEIESTGKGLYSVTIYEHPKSGYDPLIRKVDGIFKTIMGQNMIELQVRRNTTTIEILFEAKKINFDGCYYSKQ